jgi:hypothetical protein
MTIKDKEKLLSNMIFFVGDIDLSSNQIIEFIQNFIDE